jgi:hypothetical protein
LQHIHKPGARSCFAAAVLAMTACSGGVTPASRDAGTLPLANARPQAIAPKLLAVDEAGDQIVVLNSSYKPVVTIQQSLDVADCLAYDNRGNLYAANAYGGNVTEYNAVGKLIYTYASGLTEPGCVATDANRNVFVGDFNDNQPGKLVEYPQKSSVPMRSCSTGLANGGIAIDSAGDVFVSGNNPTTYGANILEYRRGLLGCHARTLRDTISFGMSLQLDQKDDLVFNDQECCVEILPRPYDRVTKIIKAGQEPIGLALSKPEGLIFIVEAGVVKVDTFPGGKPVTVLSSQDGVTDPESVAAYP